ncbi:MAG TPA: 4Fe-4S binding protein [Candidatus Cloacimonadota bacterium]|nr:4Fe-4S binding protein [Candidatus Cloacimonadota bacterium]
MKKAKITLRNAIQAAFFLLSLGILFFVVTTGKKAIHNACPYAVICFGMNMKQLLGISGQLFLAAVLLVFLIAISTIFWGRKFCGWVCPLGSIQEFLFSFRSRKYKLKQQVPFYLERKLQPGKYLILLITSVLAFIGLAYIYIRLCPFYALSQLPRLAIPGLILTALILGAAFFIDRLWCRFLCPYAAFMNLFMLLGKAFGIKRMKVRRNPERCNDCGICSLYCPMNINLLDTGLVEDPNCIHCGICSQKCPKGALENNCKEEL